MQLSHTALQGTVLHLRGIAMGVHNAFKHLLGIQAWRVSECIPWTVGNSPFDLLGFSRGWASELGVHCSLRYTVATGLRYMSMKVKELAGVELWDMDQIV
jgi:hypothetical protein